MRDPFDVQLVAPVEGQRYLLAFELVDDEAIVDAFDGQLAARAVAPKEAPPALDQLRRTTASTPKSALVAVKSA